MLTILPQPADPLTTCSPEVAAGAASTRTELEARLDAIAKLARDSHAAHAIFSDHHATKPDYQVDDDSELRIRWEINNTNRCRAFIRAEDTYHKACDAFFAAYEARTQ